MDYSFSKIQAYRNCPQKYKAMFVDKTLPSEESPELSFGTGMHLGLQAMFEGDDALLAFNVFWESVKLKNFKYGSLNWDRLHDCGNTLLERFKDRHFEHFKPLVLEVRQYGSLDGKNFEGTPDLYGLYKDTLSLCDFKTSAYPYIKEKIDAAEQHADYCELLRQNGHELPKQIMYVVFCKISPRIQIIKRDLTKDFLDALIQNTRNDIARIESDKTFPMALGKCYMKDEPCYCAKKLGLIK